MVKCNPIRESKRWCYKITKRKKDKEYPYRWAVRDKDEGGQAVIVGIAKTKIEAIGKALNSID